MVLGPSRTASRAAVKRSCEALKRYWAAGVPRSLAAADHEKELPEMPSVTHPFPRLLGAAGGRGELLKARITNRCEAAQTCCGRIWDGRLEDSRAELVAA